MRPTADPFTVTHPDAPHTVHARQAPTTGMWHLACTACPWTGYEPYRAAAWRTADAHASWLATLTRMSADADHANRAGGFNARRVLIVTVAPDGTTITRHRHTTPTAEPEPITA